ncbi:radical SAM protein [Kyrpidia spormannii]|uniref:Radical SAM protein n=2 Tax=Kyrpidia spormannii TaxID=2055160 RepID=A0A2K8NA01_9BACL|nr:MULTISPECIES: radical SAM protein [Kyrpidia]HHY66218.1 radical SAM protein [Alicyclobacillus sp.]ATY85627.1 radical SAM protein [Kyrpidia spormannii]MCL6575167.1 radical SAM protein [Kyrpidia sp.]CAB3394065.1 Radical SAM protein [Kyrpidia spormannii]CAB3395003.1 Radical SAM protein [Kyrpidia spormannii]
MTPTHREAQVLEPQTRDIKAFSEDQVEERPHQEGVPESPDAVMVSLAGAMALGIEKGKFAREEIVLRGLNVLMTYKENCSANCSYCGMSRERRIPREQTTFIRVKWPVVDLDEVIDRTNQVPHHMRRVCVGMLANHRSFNDSLQVIREFRERTDLLISGLITASLIRSREQLQMIKDAGADRVDIAIDAATEELFEKHRGRPVKGPHRWDHFWWVTEEATKVFEPGTVGIHLVVGLGETEKELLEACHRAQEMGVVTHLFSFNPEPSTLLGDWPQPPLGQYRRCQLGRYLINEMGRDFHRFRFNRAGQVVDFGVAPEELDAVIDSGLPFMTSGCPDEHGATACNRPYGNGRPSEPMRNFPFIPTPKDIEEIRMQLWSDWEGEDDAHDQSALG